MNAVQTQDLALMGFNQDGSPGARVRGTFPLHYGSGCASTAVVYFELEPGDRLPRHTDSAEELLVVLDGEAEATVGEERERVKGGGIVVVPAMVPHEVRNAGQGTLRVAGCFSSNTVVSVFDEPFAGVGRVLGTPPPAVATGS
jgi:quercetin dioxygenase-like cupin family protein